MRVLIAEDDLVAAALLRQTLERGGFQVDHAGNGREALELLREREYLLLLTDWKMPEMDGLELIARMRSEIASPPLVLFVTAVDSDESREKALESGADEFLSKPIRPDVVVSTLNALIQRRHQELFAMVSTAAPVERDEQASVEATPSEGSGGLQVVGIATSTGGPTALREVLRALPAELPAAVLVVLHGQPWVIESVVPKLQAELQLPVALATDGETLEAGKILFAPGEAHVSIEGQRIKIADGAPVNFVKPSADVLFQSMASELGGDAIAVVLTGRGQDGAAGAKAIAASGGKVLVQDPDEALAAGMPQTTLSGCPDASTAPLPGVAPQVVDWVRVPDGATTKG